LKALGTRASVLECARPLALWPSARPANKIHQPAGRLAELFQASRLVVLGGILLYAQYHGLFEAPGSGAPYLSGLPSS
jgi:hypothetical protein